MAIVTQTIAQLAPQVLQRLQDPTGIFWLQQYEVNPALAEAINDLMLLLGRPVQYFNQLITLSANTCFQALPPNVLCLTYMHGSNYTLHKTTMHSMDYTMTSWGPDWTADRADIPARWGPIGLTQFFVHPAPNTPIQVLASGVLHPVTSLWPFDPTTQAPFHEELNIALELYATAYCRLKELGMDAQEGNVLRGQYLEIAKRATGIEDRRDDRLFSQHQGVPTTMSLTTLR